MATDDKDFRVKPGRPRADKSGRGARKALSFERRVMVAVAKAGGDPKRIGKGLGGGKKGARNGRYNAHGRGAKVMRSLPRDPGWKFDHASGQRLRMRRVIVKARYVKLKGPASRASYAHLRYLQRDGVSREDERGQLYGRGLDVPDGPSFLARSAEDRHQFRFIVAPKDGVELGELKRFTRDLMDQMERDLETRLDWVAVDHHNTGHPHTHIVIRGVTEDGKALNIAGDYIAHGIRYRASEILTRELGLQSELEVAQQLDREVGQERFTRLDRTLIEKIGEDGVIEMRPETPMDGPLDAQRYRLLKRLRKLEGLGLAREVETGRWTLSAGMDKTLRELGERGDIIKTMHRIMTRDGHEPDVSGFALHTEAPAQPIIGRLAGRGLQDENLGTAYAVIEGIDGRTHHLKCSDLELTSDARPGAVVETRTYEDAKGRARLALAIRSDLTLDQQIRARGATWIDRQLLGRDSALGHAGFGAETRSAMAARAEHLVHEGLAQRRGRRIVFARDLLSTLHKRELGDVADRLAAETGLAYQPLAEGQPVSGIYRRRVTLASGRFAMIDDGLGFQLVPWRPALEDHLGREVRGIATAQGIDWSIGRKRGLSL